MAGAFRFSGSATYFAKEGIALFSCCCVCSKTWAQRCFIIISVQIIKHQRPWKVLHRFFGGKNRNITTFPEVASDSSIQSHRKKSGLQLLLRTASQMGAWETLRRSWSAARWCLEPKATPSAYLEALKYQQKKAKASVCYRVLVKDCLLQGAGEGFYRNSLLIAQTEDLMQIATILTISHVFI